MTRALIGESRGRPEGRRVPIEISEHVRADLRHLLHRQWMRGVGYSEFISRAIERAHQEAEEQGVG